MAGRDQATLTFRSPGDVALTPAQRATAWFFLMMAALFLLQTLVAGSPALPRRPRGLLRDRHRSGPALQPGPDLARAAGDLLRRHLVRRRRDLPRADDRRAGAARPEHVAYAPLGALAVVVFEPVWGARRGPRLVLQFDLRAPGLRVPGSRALLAGPPGDRPDRLGGDPLPRTPRAPQPRAGRQHALFFLAALAIPAFYAVGLLARAGQLHDHRLLAVHRRPPLGRGLPRAVHHRDGRLHVRAARGGAGEGGTAGGLPRHHPLLGRRGGRDDAPPLLLRRSGGEHGPRRVFSALEVLPSPSSPSRRGASCSSARGRNRSRRRRSRIAGR